MTQNSAQAQSSVVVGAQPRPRMLIIGFEGEDELLRRLQALSPTSRMVTHPSEVNQAEFDLLVTDKFQSPWPKPNMPPGHGTVNIAPHLNVVCRARTDTVRMEHVMPQVGAIASEFAFDPKALPSEKVARLVRDLLVPIAEETAAEGRTHRFYTAAPASSRRPPGDPRPEFSEVELNPFLTTQQGHVLAGWYSRSERSECWFLPPEVRNEFYLWVDAALNHFSDIDPERFPVAPGWETRREWCTVDEERLYLELDALKQERNRVLEDLTIRESQLLSDLATQHRAANSFERRLLVAQGDELVELVARALRELGFVVTDIDETLSAGSQRLEDLQISDPGAPDWLALAEVKGYARSGGKTADLLKIGRFVTRFVSAHGEAPSSVWYMVNHFFDQSPETRGTVLVGADEDVAGFAEAGGMVWSTTQLFQVLIAVRRGLVTAAEIRSVLREATGRLVIPGTWIHTPQSPPTAG